MALTDENGVNATMLVSPTGGYMGGNGGLATLAEIGDGLFCFFSLPADGEMALAAMAAISLDLISLGL